MPIIEIDDGSAYDPDVGSASVTGGLLNMTDGPGVGPISGTYSVGSAATGGMYGVVSCVYGGMYGVIGSS